MEMLKNCNLERQTPEEAGVDSAAIKAFIDEINEKKLGLQSFTIVRNNKICAQCFWKPYAAEWPHVLYSMSKSVTSTAVGFAVEEGLIHLDDRVSDFFPEYAMAKRPGNRKLTVRMLLTMRSDKFITVLEEKENKDWIKQFFAAGFIAPPDTKFNYISENTFMLSAIISKVTGMSMVDYLYPRMFEPLGIEKPFWEQDGKGNNAAGWGLYMRSEDLAKFFLPYLNGGKWIDGTQLIPENWVKEATKKQTDSVGDGYIDNMCGYGYQFWRNQDEKSFRADGLFGQRCYMFPQHNALVVLNSGESEDYKIMKVFWKHFPRCFQDSPLPENKQAFQEMQKCISACQVERLESAPRRADLEAKISGKKIKCHSNKYTSLISISIYNMLYKKPGNIKEMQFDFTPGGLSFTWREKQDVNTINVGMDGSWRQSEINLRDLHYHTFAEAAWQADGSLELWIRPVESAHVRKWTFVFSENCKNVKITNTMSPTFEELVIYYLTFAGQPVKHEASEKFIKKAIVDLGLPVLEPDFSGKLK
ncbi:MAG: beta-lactamase family protein [Clostridiales bacterium]|nr:beta-lactamase family protein [Clostridiales bacterium]